ncbi:MAG TPA: hypothetical protein VFQ23_09250, partial [Anaerolineales bacterium]|nr:hypothetical protein [Anaerolineales bacterium]
MKQDLSVFFQSLNLNLPATWNPLLLAGFIVLALLAGGVAAVAGAQLGWVALLAIPVLLFGLAILIRPELGLAAFVFIIYVQLNLVLAKVRPGIPSPAMLLLGALVFLIVWRMVVYGDRPLGWSRVSIILVVVIGWLFSVLAA